MCPTFCRSHSTGRTLAAKVMLLFGLLTAAAAVTLSNLELPLDTNGQPLITGETSVVTVKGIHYFYVNDWGGCAEVDCCGSTEGCASCCYVPPSAAYPDACVFTDNHTIVVYETTDFRSWRHLGAALTPAQRPTGIEFRPHVVYNAAKSIFVMWFEDRPDAISSSGYAVATAPAPEGPFTTVASKVAVADVPGDFDLLVDDDGTCWHVQTTTNDPNATRGFVVTALNAEYTAPATPRRSASFAAPKPAEGPVFFKRNGGYYILGGTTCCACRGGSSIYVFRAASPLGPWDFTGDVGSTAQPFDPHSPRNFVTRAQASAVVVVGEQYLWLGNQWVTANARNADLLYWSVLRFSSDGDVLQFVWAPEIKLPNASHPPLLMRPPTASLPTASPVEPPRLRVPRCPTTAAFGSFSVTSAPSFQRPRQQTNGTMCHDAEGIHVTLVAEDRWGIIPRPQLTFACPTQLAPHLPASLPHPLYTPPHPCLTRSIPPRTPPAASSSRLGTPVTIPSSLVGMSSNHSSLLCSTRTTRRSSTVRRHHSRQHFPSRGGGVGGACR